MLWFPNLDFQYCLRDNYADFLFPSLACAKSTRTQLRGHAWPSTPEINETYMKSMHLCAFRLQT